MTALICRLLYRVLALRAWPQPIYTGRRRWGAAMLILSVMTLLVYAPIAAAQTPAPTSSSPLGGLSTSPTNSPSVSPTAATGGSQSDPNAIQAHQETLEASVLSATQPQLWSADASSGNQVDPLTGKPTLCQKVEVMVPKGSIQGETISFEEGTIPVASKANVVYRQGDKVLVDWEYSKDQPSTYHIIDFVRTAGLWILAIVFSVLSVVFGRLRGFTSMLGLAISFGVLLLFIVPRIIAGDDP